MERIERGATPHQELEKVLTERVLRRIEDGQMLQFTPEGYRLLAYEKSDKRCSTEAPSYKTVVQRESSSLDNLLDESDSSYSFGPHPISNKIDDTEFQTWVEGLVSPEDVVEAAHLELERRRIEGNEELIECHNCRNSDASFNCSSCGGTRKSAKYPLIALKNEASGEERILKLDLAELIASGSIAARWSGYETVYSDNSQLSTKNIQFGVFDYINQNIPTIGIDQQNFVTVLHINDSEILGTPEAEYVDITGMQAYWHKNEDSPARTYFVNGQDETITASDVLNNAQLALSNKLARSYQKMRNDEGIAVGQEWILREIKPFEERLSDLKALAAEHGLSIGLTRRGVATGETGPSFYLLDSEGNPAIELSADYAIRDSLENAWLHLQAMTKRSAANRAAQSTK